MSDVAPPPAPPPEVEVTPLAGAVQRQVLGGVFRLSDIPPFNGQE